FVNGRAECTPLMAARAITPRSFRPDHDRAAHRVALEAERPIRLRRIDFHSHDVCGSKWSGRRCVGNQIDARPGVRVPEKSIDEDRRLAIRWRNYRRAHRGLAAL